jgi:hypothetical protein
MIKMLKYKNNSNTQGEKMKEEIVRERGGRGVEDKNVGKTDKKFKEQKCDRIKQADSEKEK